MSLNKKLYKYFSGLLLIMTIFSGSLLTACGSDTPEAEEPVETEEITEAVTNTEEVVVMEQIIPTPIMPMDTMATHKPTYEWTKNPEVTDYNLQLFEGETKKFGKVVPASECGTDNCSITPAWILADGNYKWRVRAKVGGVWQPFTEFTNFSVATQSE